VHTVLAENIGPGTLSFRIGIIDCCLHTSEVNVKWAGSCEYSDEPSGSGATELVS
jgi:hypothetical protein